MRSWASARGWRWGPSGPHRSAADLNASPLQVLTADADTASPARTFGLAAGVSVVLALAIQAPELALLPVLAFVGLFGVAHLLDQSGWPAGPEGRAWIVYGVGVTGMLLAVIAFFPRPWISVTVAAAAVTAGALVLRRPGAQPGQPAWTHDAAGATADEVGGYDSAVPGGDSAVPGENSPVPGSAVAVIAREDGGRPPSPSRLTVLFAQFLELGRSVFSGLGWVGVVLVLFGLAFLNAQGLPAFVRFALVFVLFLLAIRAGLACRQVLDEGSRSGGLEALGLLVIPVGVLLVFMVFDFGLGLVFFFPMFLTVLLAARVDRLPMRVLGGSALLVALVTFGAWSVLRPSTANLRNAESVAEFSDAYAGAGSAVARLLSIAGASTPVTRATVRSLASREPELLEEALAFAGPSEALVAAAPSLEQVWGGRAHAASGWTGTGFAGTTTLGRGIPIAVSYAENTFSVYILSEHGALGGIAVLLLYLSLLVPVAIWIVRVRHQVQNTPSGLAAVAMAVGGVLWLTLPAAYVAASNIGSVPLTGQNMPFLGLNSWADVVLVSGVSTGILFGLSAVDTEDESTVPAPPRAEPNERAGRPRRPRRRPGSDATTGGGAR